MKLWSLEDLRVIVRLPSLVMTARRVVGGDFERCTIFDDKDMDMEMVGGLGRELTTEKSSWVYFDVDFDTTSFAGSEGGNDEFGACSSRSASSR